MTILQIENSARFAGDVIFWIGLAFVVVPISIYLCVKLGTSAFYITQRKFSEKKEKDQ